MKTQLSKPSRSKASYTDEYKREALELWRARGRSAARGGDGAWHPPAVALSLGTD